ncbi:MAG: ACP S-malonyltransferase [Rhodospirillales bacterium]|jgi:[acyl-carrier-protein] S-malonyltransferase|uniref:[acyl-carrier-protein] S-malonyltransferase n=1 Tax=metagenome TaxID=256318 RepID=A0A380TCT1_9ZZZZ|nr:ACP S-malonyltransferase [Rhodospirillales bacterium]MDG4604068.1 ACP S-malonyltransferase [Defluviicoccus sp.]SUS05813.1 Malonyl CoA-acyl carrier protein transacylase [uncultured Defluviicoccus sp.]HOT82229.1 ACP S-malonyltransferase [Candidatus Defluviicoccus seviourii]MDG4608669.1 ACP S-malonyltransferase [Defluviicoccus sp.]
MFDAKSAAQAIEPSETTAAARRALVFPGQGSQAVGMGTELAASFPTARQVFQEVDDALGQNLSQLMADGPEQELTLTENAQPALMAVSVAVLRVLEKDFGADLTQLGSFVAGHSLGEYTALTAAGTFTIVDAARLLRTRGLAMQTAVPVGEGAMAALMGVELTLAQEIASEATRDTYDGSVCVAANDNAPGQVVISGNRTAVQRAIDIAGLRGAKRSVLLPVSGPFHCPLMAPVANVMDNALANVQMQAPKIPLISNVSAREVAEPEEIRKLLVQQVTGMVRWRESVLYMCMQGVVELVEIGAGKVLSGLAKRIDRRLSGLSVGTPAGIEAFAKTL